MRVRGLALVAILCSSAPFSRAADPCESERAEFPKDWNDTSKEKLLAHCTCHYLTFDVLEEPTSRALTVRAEGKVYRAEPPPARIDYGSAAEYLGKPVPLPLWAETTCAIRGDFSPAGVLALTRSGSDLGGLIELPGSTRVELVSSCELVK